MRQAYDYWQDQPGFYLDAAPPIRSQAAQASLPKRSLTSVDFAGKIQQSKSRISRYDKATIPYSAESFPKSAKFLALSPALRYKYSLVERPVAFGTYPKGANTNPSNLGKKTFTEAKPRSEQAIRTFESLQTLPSGSSRANNQCRERIAAKLAAIAFQRFAANSTPPPLNIAFLTQALSVAKLVWDRFRQFSRSVTAGSTFCASGCHKPVGYQTR